MRGIAISALVTITVMLAGTNPGRSAPANGSAVCKAMAEMNVVTQVRCWCSYRTFSGRCQRWRCR